MHIRNRLKSLSVIFIYIVVSNAIIVPSYIIIFISKTNNIMNILTNVAIIKNKLEMQSIYQSSLDPHAELNP